MNTDPTVRVLLRVNRVCDEFEAEHRAGKSPRLEAFVAKFPADAVLLLEHLLPLDIAYRRRSGERPCPADYADRFPALGAARLARAFADPDEVPFPTVLGEYDLVRRIGAGGMGVVYLARHRRMNREVALKAVPPTAPDRDELLERFAREVEITATLAHPNVVAAFDAREDDGVCYLVTAYLDGGDLGRLVKRSGSLPIAGAVRAVRDAALGLAHAHDCRVVHRDVKPSNLLADATGRVCVADWGLAKTATPSRAARQLTAAGVTLGTVDYLAPELAGQSENADARSDVYSLGCVLFYLLVGRPPFPRADLTDRLDAHRTAPVPDLAALRPEVPAALAALVARMMAKSPAARPQDMHAVAAALDGINAPRRRFTRRALIAGGVAAVLVPGVVVGVRRLRPVRTVVPPTVADVPFDDPRDYQRQWAEHLGVPVERVDEVGGTEFRFVLVPPGRFQMGTSEDLIAQLVARPGLSEWQRRVASAEQIRRVTIPRPFYLGTTEVTVSQFSQFIARTRHATFTDRGAEGWGYHGPGVGWKLGPGYHWNATEQFRPTPAHPVANVAWSDALAFCEWLGNGLGAVCRLPCESEWEYACRGGRYGLWGHGDAEADLRAFAVYATDLPSEVAGKKANGFGLFDMHGNAAEMCEVEDRWADDPASPVNAGSGMHPVRGGRFNEIPAGADDTWPGEYRCARREWEPRGSLSAGFRVLREIAT